MTTRTAVRPSAPASPLAEPRPPSATSSVRCVRCGLRSRDHETFLCEGCLTSPVMRVEVEDAERTTGDVREQRVHLVTAWGWVGGWNRRSGHRTVPAATVGGIRDTSPFRGRVAFVERDTRPHLAGRHGQW